jgi:hypothetical protein
MNIEECEIEKLVRLKKPDLRKQVKYHKEWLRYYAEQRGFGTIGLEADIAHHGKHLAAAKSLLNA